MATVVSTQSGYKPFISVVVPFRNESRFIAACAESLTAQAYDANAHELLFVDNNSTDSSAQIVARFPCIRLLQEHKQGAYAARNCGLQEARGEIVAFTDADCAVAPDWLEQVAVAMSQPQVRIVIGAHRFGRRSLLLSMLEAYEEEKKRYTFSSPFPELYHGHNNNMAVRREALEALGGLAERQRGADTLLVRACVDRYGCQSVVHHSPMVVRHLEIESVVGYYAKSAVYRNSRLGYRHIARVRGLTNRERVLVFQRTVQRQHYSPTRAALLFGVLTVGLSACALGGYWLHATRAEVKG